MNRNPAERRTGRTALFLTIAVLANSFGNLLLSIGMGQLPGFGEVDLAQYISRLIHDPFLLPGAALSAVYALVQISLFSWADLSFVVPCMASSYIVSTLLAQFVLGEQILAVRWCGVLLIFFGVLLVAKTPVATKRHSLRTR